MTKTCCPRQRRLFAAPSRCGFAKPCMLLCSTLIRQVWLRIRTKSFLGLMLFSLVGLVSGCQQGVTDTPSQAASKADQKKSRIRVDVVAVTAVNEVPVEHVLFASLEPTATQVLAFPWTGVVKRLAAVGTHLKAGEVVAELDDRTLLAQRDQLIQTLEQTTRLAEREALQRDLRAIEQQLATRILRAPFDCVVDETYTQINEIQTERAPVARVIADGPPNASVTVPTRMLANVAVGTRYAGELDGASLDCQVISVSKEFRFDGQLETRLQLSTSPPIEEWTSEELIRLIVVQWQPFEGYAVPTTSLHQQLSGDWYVNAVAKESGSDRIRRTSVQLQFAGEEWAVVQGDLQSNRWLVPRGSHRFTWNQEVEVHNVTEQFPLPSRWNRSP